MSVPYRVLSSFMVMKYRSTFWYGWPITSIQRSGFQDQRRPGSFRVITKHGGILGDDRPPSPRLNPGQRDALIHCHLDRIGNHPTHRRLDYPGIFFEQSLHPAGRNCYQRGSFHDAGLLENPVRITAAHPRDRDMRDRKPRRLRYPSHSRHEGDDQQCPEDPP